MREEKFLNALEFLDDSMIEAVNKRRERKKKRKMYMMRILAGAACLCIVFAGLLVSNTLYLFLQDKFKYTEDYWNNHRWEGSWGNEESIIGVKPEPTIENNKESEGFLEEASTVIIKITNWQEYGFEGTVAGLDDTKIFALENEVIVVFGENVCIGVWNENVETYVEIDRVPTSTDFPEESIVKVRFNRYQKDSNQSVIYAKSVSPT